jgi:hypothetical protein
LTAADQAAAAVAVRPSADDHRGDHRQPDRAGVTSTRIVSRQLDFSAKKVIRFAGQRLTAGWTSTTS